MRKHIGFKALAQKVARRYRSEGVSSNKAELWGIETAGKIYGEQQRRKRKRRRK